MGYSRPMKWLKRVKKNSTVQISTQIYGPDSAGWLVATTYLCTKSCNNGFVFVRLRICAKKAVHVAASYLCTKSCSQTKKKPRMHLANDTFFRVFFTGDYILYILVRVKYHVPVIERRLLVHSERSLTV